MDKTNIIEIVKSFAELIKRRLPVKSVILFGSHVNGNARVDSDIDVAVIVEAAEIDHSTIEFELFKLRREIDLRIEPVLFYNKTQDPSGFFDTILKTGKIVYQN